MANGEYVFRICDWCKQQFQCLALDVKRGRGRYCSDRCKKSYGAAHNGPSVNNAAKLKKDARLLDPCNGCDGSCAVCPYDEKEAA